MRAWDKNTLHNCVVENIRLPERKGSRSGKKESMSLPDHRPCWFSRCILFCNAVKIQFCEALAVFVLIVQFDAITPNGTRRRAELITPPFTALYPWIQRQREEVISFISPRNYDITFPKSSYLAGVYILLAAYILLPVLVVMTICNEIIVLICAVIWILCWFRIFSIASYLCLSWDM